MSVNGIENIEYYFMYRTTGIQQADFQLKCSSCGKFKPQFNTYDPYFAKPLMDNRYRWQLWSMFGKIGKADLTDFMDESITATNYTAGLTLEMEYDCNVNQTICTDTPNFTSNPIHASMAHAILYKAAELTLRSIVGSSELSRKNLVKTEEYQAWINDYSAKYNEYMNWIVDNVTLSDTDCLECKDNYGMIKRRI